MENKIQLKHPEGKKAVAIDKLKYNLIREAILKYLKKKDEATHTEIWEAVTDYFKKSKTKFEGSIQWYIEWVKLDLIANKIINKVDKTSPQKFKLNV